jgi:hypothetical protein
MLPLPFSAAETKDDRISPAESDIRRLGGGLMNVELVGVASGVESREELVEYVSLSVILSGEGFTRCTVCRPP